MNSKIHLPRNRQFNIYLILLFLFIVLSALLYFLSPHLTNLSSFPIPESWKDNACGNRQPAALDDSPLPLDEEHEPFRHRHIAVASTFHFHFDVYMAIVWTLHRVFQKNHEVGTIQVFANQPFSYAFNDILAELAIYDGSYKKPQELFEELRHGNLDLVILGTCEIDLRGDKNTQLLKIWDDRELGNKFMVVCVVHDVGDTAWQSSITDWTRRDSIRILSISEHVARAFRRKFLVLADSHNITISSAGYENIPVDVHVPILNVTLPSHSGPAAANETLSNLRLSNVVIQGSFSSGRRDYGRVFQDLISILEVDPRVWGYLPLNSTSSLDSSAYGVDSTVQDPFHLYLIGSGHIDVPTPLKNVVSVHTLLNYSDFYNLMGTMDLCLPAFAENGYYEQQASSTFAMALECDVPLLVTQRMRDAYSYADDDHVMITRPAAIRDVEALRLFRMGIVDEDASSHILEAKRKMLDSGWKRTDPGSWMTFKEKVWKQNDRAVEKILRGQS